MDVNQTVDIKKEYIKRSADVNYAINLPSSEFDVMLAVWSGEPPITTGYLMKQLGTDKGWKSPTLISFLGRLEERGFVMSYKKGKERYYLPLADRDTYISNATKQFLNQYHSGSFVNFLDSLFKDKQFENNDIDELLMWLKTK